MSDPVNMRLTDDLVSSLREALGMGGAGLRSIPVLLEKLMDEDRWKSRIVAQTNQQRTYVDFKKFVTDPPLDGLGADPGLVRSIIKDNVILLAKWDRLMVGKHGTHEYKKPGVVDNNVINYSTRNSPVGNSRQQAIHELDKKRPDLLEKVERGELSPHRAAIQAGHRTGSLTISLKVEAAARTLKRHFSQDDLQRLISLLQQVEQDQ